MLAKLRSKSIALARSKPSKIRISHLNQSKPANPASLDKPKPDIFSRPEIALYYISIYAHDRQCLFGEVKNQQVDLNLTGQAVQECWYDLPVLFPNLHLDLSIVMPNHIHAIISLNKLASKNAYVEEPDWTGKSSITSDIREIIQRFIDISTKYVIEFNAAWEGPVWRTPFEHELIKNESRLNLLREYIADNPAMWDQDLMNPTHRVHTTGALIASKRPAS